MGEWVDVDSGVVPVPSAGYVGGENVILQQFNSSTLLVDELKALIIGHIDDLKLTIEEVEMPNNWTDVISGVIINPVPALPGLSIPAPGPTPVLPDFTEVNFPGLPFLKVAPTIDTSFVEPVAPDDVDPTISYMNEVYSSAMWTSLFNKIQAAIDSGTGTGIDPAVEAALHFRSSERKRVANEKAQAVAARTVSGRGLSFPGIIFTTFQNQMAAEILNQEHASSVEIEIASAEFSQKFAMFAIERGIDLERILRGFYEVQAKLSLEAQKAIAELVISNYAEKAKMYIAKWQGQSAKLKAMVDSVMAVVSENQNVIEGFKAEMQGAIAQTEQISKERESIVSVAKTEAEVYKARVDAEKAWYDALSENQKAQLQKSELELRKAVEELKAILDSRMSINGIKKDYLSTLTQVFAQVMSAALNTVQTSVGHSTNRSAGITEHYGHAESISEDHNYDETK